MDALREDGPLDQTEIYNLFQRHRSSARIANALALLIDAGLVTVTKETSAHDGSGRDRTVYRAT